MPSKIRLSRLVNRPKVHNWINSGVFFRIEIYILISDDITQFGVKVGELKESMSDELNKLKSSNQEIKGIIFSSSNPNRVGAQHCQKLEV